MNAGYRVAQERGALGLGQRELAEKVTRLGYPISQTGIDKIEKRDTKRPKCVSELSRALNVTDRWLLTGREPKHPPPPDRGLPISEVPILDWVSAGKLSQSIFQDDEKGRIAISGLDNRGDWIALKVDGDSMDRISPPDSIIVINRNDKRLVPNACYVFGTLNGEATYKRYRPGPPPRFEPVSTNPAHEPLFPDQEPFIVGRVVYSILDLT